MSASYDTRCFCGAVEFTAAGEPAAMGYCHCDSCREWSAGPVNAFTLWPEGSVRVTRGAEQIGGYNKTASSERKWCKNCGGHLFTEHPDWHLTDVYAALLPKGAFRPTLHVNYQQARLQVRDGLPKMRDLPKEMGGSGETMPE